MRRKEFILEKEEIEMIKIIEKIEPCTFEDVHSFWQERPILSILRSMHIMLDKGFLRRINIGNKRVYYLKRDQILVLLKRNSN